MKHGKYYGRKILSFLIALALTAGMCLCVGNTTYAEGESFTLGAFNYTDGKFDNATGSGTEKYKSLLIAYGEAPVSGEALTLPTEAGFVKSDTASTNYSTVINMSDGKTPSEIAEYVKGITFTGSADHLGQTIMVTISEQVIKDKVFYFEGTKHYYQYIKYQDIGTSSSNPGNHSWVDAYNAAKDMTYAGRKGYLATVTSWEEDLFIYKASDSVGWLGGTVLAHGDEDGSLYYESFDKNADNTDGWYWACGPEKGMIFFGKETGNGNHEKNWKLGRYFNFVYNQEPSKSTHSGESCVTTLLTGQGCAAKKNNSDIECSWNDGPESSQSYHSTYGVKGYFVEYGDETIGDSGNISGTDKSITDIAKFPKVVVLPSANGSLTASKNAETVTLTANPADHYMLDDIVFLSSDSAAPLNMTGVAGSSDSYSNLLIDDKTWEDSYNSSSTENEQVFYAIFKADKKCILKEYTLTTGTDQNKNWKKWTLYGGNFDTDPNNGTDGWKQIDSENIKDTNGTQASQSYKYSIDDNDRPYQYYMFEIDYSQGYSENSNQDSIEMKKVEFSGITVKDTPISLIPETVSYDTNTYSFTMPSENVYVLPYFKKQYTVSYDANEGTGSVPETQYCLPNNSITVAEKGDLTREGYTFGGWTTGEYEGEGANKHLKIYKHGDSLIITKNTNLSAVWNDSVLKEVSVTGYTGEYDGKAHSITVTPPENVGEISVSYSETKDGSYNAQTPSYTDVGEHTVYYKLQKDDDEILTGVQTINITPKLISISVSDMTKEYGKADPVISESDYIHDELLSGDVIDSITLTRKEGKDTGVYAYNSSDASCVIKHGDVNVSNNYSVSFIVGFLTITPKVVTITDEITAKSKTYNGTTLATLEYKNATAWKVGSDDVTISATGEFKDKNAGTGKDVIISDIKLSGAADVLKNYKLAETGQQTSCKADITKKSVTVSGITANSKHYDGTNAATLDTSKAVITGKIEGDKLSVTASGAFADAEIGDSKTVNITNLKLTGEDANNYVIDTSVSQTTGTANITKPQIIISGIKAVDRAYNGNNSATLDFSQVTYEGKLEGDTVNVTATGTFVDKNVGKDKRVAISELELTGKDAGKYELAAKGQQYSTTASITKRPVTISQISASDKVYDGTTDVTLDKDKIIIGGKIDGDVLDVVVKGGFADKNIGGDKDIIVDKKSIQLSGADADNYELNLTDFKTDSLKASITPRPVTISGITVKDKVYDGTTDVEFDYAAAAIGNKVENDKLSFTATGALADKNVGVDKSVAINDIELAGDDKANYVLAEEGQQTECMAKVTAKEITVSGIEVKDKGYDGKTEAEFTYDKIVITGLVENDKLTVAAEGEFSGKDSGSDKTVSISKITLAGEDAANYVLAKTGQQTECKADIKAASVLVSGITAESREYDGKATAELNLKDAVISGVAEGDRVSVSATGVYEDEYVGTGKKVAIKGMQLTGKDAANYELAEEGQQTECIADINKRVLTITGLKPVDKVYDGTDQVTFADDEVVTEGKLEDDNVSIKVKGTYTDGESGEAKKITITDVILGGRDGDNYVVDRKSLSATFTSNINIVNSTVEQVTNKDGSVTYNETSYNDVGKEERTVATTVDAKGDITQMVVKEAEGGEIVITDASEVTYGGSKETVEEVVAYIKNNKKENAEKGSVLYDNAVTPEKMAFILKDNKATTKILNDALQAGNDSTRTGGANVIVKGMDSKLDTDKAEVLKLALTPTEIVDMLSSGKTTDVVLELKENTSKEGADKAADSAKAKLSELVKNDEEYYYFDCDMYKVVSGSNVKTGLTEFASKIKISFPLPEKLRAKNRSFRVIASHTDKTTGVLSAYEIPCKVDNAYNLSFETDKLCLMTLAYTDEAIKARAMTVAPEVLEANTLALNEGLKIDQTGSKLNVVWGKVDKAENYDVFVQYCGKNFSSTPEKTVNGNTVKATVTKINGKKLNLKKNYKIYVVAYKVVDGKKVTLAKTITGHVVGRKNTKYSNAKSIKLKSGTKITLKKGKTSKIKAKTVLVAKGKKQLSDAHAKEFRYASSDKKVATVSSKGKIKAVGKGSCIVYVYSRNGYAKKVSVTVK